MRYTFTFSSAIFAFGVLALIGTLAPLRNSSAHVLQTDGSMGAVLHIDPNDAPIAAQPAYFFLDFASKGGTFTLANCTCNAVLSTTDGTVLARPTINPIASQTSEGTFQYQFSSSNEYLLTVSGAPVSGNAFQTFTLKYTFQVAAAQASGGGRTNGFKAFLQSEHGLHYLLFGAGFIVIFFLFLNELKKNKNNSPQKEIHEQKNEHEIE
jgi:hypothetical protein